MLARMAYLTAPYFIESLESRAEQFLLFFFSYLSSSGIVQFHGFRTSNRPSLIGVLSEANVEINPDASPQ